MFYSYDYNVAFVHVPRTGGVAISMAFRPWLGLGSGWDLAELRHLNLDDMKRLCRDWRRLRFFSVYRPLAEIRRSFDRFIAAQKAILKDQLDTLTPTWKAILLADDPLGEVWQRNRWPETESAWLRFWYGTWPTPEVRILDFSSLEAELARLVADWCLPPVRLPEHSIN